jgi:hypothetical protein
MGGLLSFERLLQHKEEVSLQRDSSGLCLLGGQFDGPRRKGNGQRGP